MKFKREDLGLYFAFGLVGGGVGLLIGALITSRLPERPRPSDNFDNEEVDDGRFARIDPSLTFTPIQEVVDNLRQGHDEKSPEEKSKKQNRKKRISEEDEARLNSLIEEYEVTTVQIELVRSGVLTVEQLETALLKDIYDEKREPYNYNEPYTLGKPDLDDLVDDEELLDDLPARSVADLLVVVDGKYEILLDPPKDKDPRNKRVIWYDVADDSIYTLNRSGDPIPRTIEGIATDEVWEILRPFLIFEKELCPIYVDNLGTTRYYEFNRVEESEEDSVRNSAHTS